MAFSKKTSGWCRMRMHQINFRFRPTAPAVGLILQLVRCGVEQIPTYCNHQEDVETSVVQNGINHKAYVVFKRFLPTIKQYHQHV